MKGKNTMKKNLTELVFILDRSGSMSGLEADTIGGFNGMIDKQKKEEGEALVTAVLFDDRIEVLYDGININDVDKMTDDDYFVRGSTALLDAIGSTISRIKAANRKKSREDRREKTIFVITTDGMENSSSEYSYKEVKRMIEDCQDNNWEFIFLGANIDAAKEAGKMGIKASRAINYVSDSKGTELNYKVLGNAISKMRSCPEPMMMSSVLDDESWSSEIQADYLSRKKI